VNNYFYKEPDFDTAYITPAKDLSGKVQNY